MKIGKLEKVDLREVWANEAKDFTSWLYQNLGALGEEVELNLFELKQEKKLPNSRFCADILAETENGECVVIENQLEATDHKHLGQLITYLTNMDMCTTAIWIVKEPRQEHINAVNWLNRETDKAFYLVKLEAYRIGDSAPAPFFSVICSPSEEDKQFGEEKRVIKDGLKARKELRDQADCVIVPAQEEGFNRVFIGEHQWHSIRIGKDKIQQLKWIAGYQVSPISAITHIAKIKEILPFQNTSKYVVVFDGPAIKLSRPIGLGSNSSRAPQSPIYINKDCLDASRNLDEAFERFAKKSK